MVTSRVSLASLVASHVFLLAACGGSPPSSNAQAAVRDAVFADNTQAYSAGAEGADVVGISLASWTKEKDAVAPGLPPRYESTWTAKLRLKEPLGVILEQVDGTKIVRIMADKGAEIAFQGTIGAMRWEDRWEIHAFSAGEPWKALFDETGGLPMGYRVIDGGSQNFAFRNTTFVPLSKLGPYVIEGSEEWKKMIAAAVEKQRQAQEAQAERLRLQREAAESQRLAREQALQGQRQKAQEEAEQRAAAARQARLEPTIKPFQSQNGLLLTSATGPSSLIAAAEVDEAAFTARGSGVDFRDMPFREFTFESSCDERGIVTFKTSLAEAPLQLRAAANDALSGQGITLAPLAAAERARLDETLALGKRLGAAAPLTIAPEVIEPAALAAREAGLELSGLSGTVVYLSRIDARVNPLFAGDLKQNRPYAWRGQQVVALRLAEPVKGSGLYYRGSNATDNLLVTINGVHTVKLAAVPRLGAAVIPLPADLEILDLRLEARGSASARTIGLIK
jgi:hypothetical protein